MRKTMIGLALAGLLTGVGTGAHAQDYTIDLDYGDEAVISCGLTIDVTTFGPGAATVACVKGAPSMDGAGRDAASESGLVYYLALDALEFVDVTCPGALAIEAAGQTATLGCGL